MGGEHKCPLCSATFTRPQHVGRHLRAHTGDRPYECKECPLRFARSDLLSRHVNKAHRPPDGNGKPPQGKKGRRKSLSSGALPQPPGGASSTSASDKLRRASMDQPRPNFNAGGQVHPFSGHNVEPPPAQPSQPPLQAQRMYPHHPLLAGTPPSQTIPTGPWTSSQPIDMLAMSMPNLEMPFPASATMVPQTIGPNGYVTFQPPFSALPMRMTGSDQGPSMGRAGSPASVNSMGSLSGMGYEFGFKKRACDQCNHSKVRCDFAEPCQRCAHRNLHCTYNKPQKSRTIPATTNPRTSLPMSASSSGLSASGGANSASPQSQFSSPHSTTSPVTATMPPPPFTRPQYAQVSLNDPNSVYAPTQIWQNDQWQTLVNLPVDQNHGFIQRQAGMVPAAGQSGPALQNLVGQVHPVPLPHRSSGSSINSPQNYLAPTPSLTSHSTSPSGSDEPAERRLSGSSYKAPWVVPGGKSAEQANFPVEGFVPNSNSPSHFKGGVDPGNSELLEESNLFAWAPPAAVAIDPRLQFRTPVHADEEEIAASRPTSSNASTYREGLDGQTLNALNASRRSSLTSGIWANAFDQMSLQDPSVAIPPDPYTASQIAQLATRRPTFPVMAATQNGTASKIPSTGNVNELWKLFMAEPMSASMGHSSSTDYMDLKTGSVLTPRPTLGARGLSRSNSMPDLTSPLNGQQFFASYMSGITPKPTLPQASYVHAQVEAAASQPGEDNGAALKRWKDSINNRQASFEFDAKAHSKLKSTSPAASVSPPSAEASNVGAITSLNESISDAKNRPLASVLQRSSALQQTLAPERLPSFGVNDLPTTTKNGWMSRTNGAKFTSALARPGNKRLASQTLVPVENGKKFELDPSAWDGFDQNGMSSGADSRGFSTPSGLVGLSTGMTPNVIGNQYFAWNTTAPNTAS